MAVDVNVSPELKAQVEEYVSLVDEYWTDGLAWLVTGGLRILLALVLLAITLKITGVVSRRLFARLSRSQDAEYLKRVDTMQSIATFTVKIVVFAVGIFVVLGELGIDLGPILAAAGVVGVAVGFGAQSLVSDVISGFFILMEDQVRVGDVVQVGDKSGVVERITLRLIILRDLSGNVHFLRNGQVDVITNMTKVYSRYVFDVGVGYREDVEQVMAVMDEVFETVRKDPFHMSNILEPLEILGLDSFGDSAVIVKARAKTRPGAQWSVAREYNKRLKQRFDELDIEIPFPHLTLYPGVDKEGGAPMLHVLARTQQEPPSETSRETTDADETDAAAPAPHNRSADAT